MTPRPNRRIAVATTAVLAAASLVACAGEEQAGDTSTGSADTSSTGSTGSSSTGSSGTGSSSESSTDESASGDSGSAGSSSDTLAPTSTDTGEPFDPEEFTDRLEAAVAETPTTHVVISIDSGGTTGESEGDQNLVTGEMEMDLDVAGQQATYRFVDGTYYLKQGSKWIAVDPETTDPSQRAVLDQVAQTSMKRQFDSFVAGIVGAGTKGQETVGGAETTHYTATVDTEKALAAVGDERAEGQPAELVYDVWLDDRDLIRKMEFDLGDLTATMTADDWGLPVSVDAPDSSDLAG